MFVYSSLSVFVKQDIEIFENAGAEVHRFHAVETSRLKLVLSLVRAFFYLLFRIWKFDAVYIWFADYHSCLPILFSQMAHKKSFLVIGGYDVSRFRQYKYGSFTNPVRGYMAKYSMKHAGLNLCVSVYVQRVLRAILPDAPSVVVYNGISLVPELTGDANKRDKEKTVLCVSLVRTRQKYFIKGIDRFIRVCRMAENVNFIAIGIEPDLIKKMEGELPSNLQLIPPLPHKELICYYLKAHVYCQLSRAESFSLSLAEAMLYNCIPVISNVGGIPEVAGPYGYKVGGEAPEEIVRAIYSALSEKTTGHAIGRRIEEMFTCERRGAVLCEIVSRELQ